MWSTCRREVLERVMHMVEKNVATCGDAGAAICDVDPPAESVAPGRRVFGARLLSMCAMRWYSLWR